MKKEDPDVIIYVNRFIDKTGKPYLRFKNNYGKNKNVPIKSSVSIFAKIFNAEDIKSMKMDISNAFELMFASVGKPEISLEVKFNAEDTSLKIETNIFRTEIFVNEHGDRLVNVNRKQRTFIIKTLNDMIFFNKHH